MSSADESVTQEELETMGATETLTNESASGPRWVRWSLVLVLAGAGAAVRSATADSATPVPPVVSIVAPSPTPVLLPSVPETVHLQGLLPPAHCFPTAALAEHMMLDWRVQVTCVRAYLHTVRRGAPEPLADAGTGRTRR